MTTPPCMWSRVDHSSGKYALKKLICAPYDIIFSETSPFGDNILKTAICSILLCSEI